MAYNNVKVKERQTVSQSSQTKPLGIVSEVPMNEWNAAVSYEKLNLVTYKNATFIAKRANVNIPPLDTANWEETWMLLKSGIGISSVVVEYAKGDVTSSNPPQSGWSTDLPSPEVRKLLWTRVTITYTDGTSTVYYSVGVSSAPTKTSDLINDGDGTSPFATVIQLDEEAQRAMAAEQANDKKIAAETARAESAESGIDTRVKSIESKIPTDASADNPLETKNFINSSINALAAFFITPTATGDKAWASRAALLGAKTFYSGGIVRVPTQNDYAIVLADESQEKGVDGTYPTTRYSYQGGTYPNGLWSFQYIVNNTSLTQAQVDALNSGINAASVAQINTNKNDIAALKSLGTVRYDIVQSLTAAQQQQARANLGALSSADLSNYVTLDTVQVISAKKDFEDGIRVNGNPAELNDAGIFLDDGDSDIPETRITSQGLIRTWADWDASVTIYFPQKSGDLALVSDITWANLPDKPTIPTIPNLSRTVSGSGNAVTDITVSGHTITITKGETFAKNADLTALTGRVSTIEGKIPTQASATDQLAPKSFVNSTVQTATANFRGNWETWASVPSAVDSYPVDYAGSKTPTVNDYLVVQDASGFSGKTLTGTWRFKYSGTWGTNGKNGWQPEYQVNETPLTAAQLAALNSGITSTGVGQITTNKNDIAALKSLGTVRYDIVQSLTAAQQQQARANLGAGTPYILPVASATTLGGVKSSTTGTDGTDYNVQVNADGTMKVNVPKPDLSRYMTTDTVQNVEAKKTFKKGIDVFGGGVGVDDDADAGAVYHAYGILVSEGGIPDDRASGDEGSHFLYFPTKTGTLMVEVLVEKSGEGNAVTDVTVDPEDKSQIHVTLGKTFATLDTQQTITEKKIFNAGIEVGKATSGYSTANYGSDGICLFSYSGTSVKQIGKLTFPQKSGTFALTTDIKTYTASTGISISTSNAISTTAASPTASGHVSTGAQSFAGRKNFNGGINIPSGATIQLSGSSGSEGQVLMTHGTSKAPTWETPSGGSALDAYPVGSIYLCWYYASSTSDTYHPAKLFGGSWTAIPSGYALWTYRSSLSATDSAHELSAGLPNIIGKFGNLYLQRDSANNNWSIIDGAFKIDGDWDNYAGGTLLERGGQIKFDASMSNSIYGNSTTVQPPAYRVFAWRRTA